jgi:hypothetical protein
MAVEKVLQEALARSREDRERVMERRKNAVEEGRARLIPHEEVFAELRARFPPR